MTGETKKKEANTVAGGQNKRLVMLFKRALGKATWSKFGFLLYVPRTMMDGWMNEHPYYVGERFILNG